MCVGGGGEINLPLLDESELEIYFTSICLPGNSSLSA